MSHPAVSLTGGSGLPAAGSRLSFSATRASEREERHGSRGGCERAAPAAGADWDRFREMPPFHGASGHAAREHSPRTGIGGCSAGVGRSTPQLYADAEGSSAWRDRGGREGDPPEGSVDPFAVAGASSGAGEGGRAGGGGGGSLRGGGRPAGGVGKIMAHNCSGALPPPPYDKRSFEELRRHVLSVSLRPDLSVDELREMQQQLAVMQNALIGHLERVEVCLLSAKNRLQRAWKAIEISLMSSPPPPLSNSSTTAHPMKPR